MSVTPDPTPASSPDPGVPQTADKAKAGGTIAGGVLVAALFLALYFDGKNGTSWAETVTAVAVALAGGGATYAGVFQTKNRRKPKDKVHHRG